MPVLARVDHERGDHRAIGPAFLYLRDLAKVCFRRAIADELDVIQARHSAVAIVDRGVTRRNIADRVADRFPNDSAPASFESAVSLVGRVCGWAGRDPKRVWRFDAGKVGRE